MIVDDWYAVGVRHGRNANVKPMMVFARAGRKAQAMYAAGFRQGRGESAGRESIPAGGREPAPGGGAPGLGVRHRRVRQGIVERLPHGACGDVWGIQSWGANSMFWDEFHQRWKQP